MMRDVNENNYKYYKHDDKTKKLKVGKMDECETTNYCKIRNNKREQKRKYKIKIQKL